MAVQGLVIMCCCCPARCSALRQTADRSQWQILPLLLRHMPFQNGSIMTNLNQQMPRLMEHKQVCAVMQYVHVEISLLVCTPCSAQVLSIVGDTLFCLEDSTPWLAASSDQFVGSHDCA